MRIFLKLFSREWVLIRTVLLLPLWIISITAWCLEGIYVLDGVVGRVIFPSGSLLGIECVRS
jgi:hypothetical protein